MSEPAKGLLPLEALSSQKLSRDLRELLDQVVDVARRLDHNVLSPEHLLVVGAEQGWEPMARTVPSLAAFREALLDALFSDREVFRYVPSPDEEQCFVNPELARLFERFAAGEPADAVLAEVMLGDQSRIQQAVAYARGTEPDVLPPDTIILEQALAPSEASMTDASAAAPRPQQSNARQVPVGLPFTGDLGAEAEGDVDLVGRTTILDQVARILLRFHQPSVLLSAPAGAGKTAFVRGLARLARTGGLPSLAGFHFYRLKLLDLVAQSHRGQDVHGIVDQILDAIAVDDKGVLVVDDLHLLVAKQGYPLMSDLIDTIKLHVSKGAMRALLTVDADAYQKSFGGDSLFGSQITVKSLPTLERDALLLVATAYRPRLERHFDVKIDDEALEAAVVSSLSEDAGEYVPPGSTIRLLDEACAMARAESTEHVGRDHVLRCHREEPASATSHDRQRLRDLEERLSSVVLGQELAASAVGRRVRLAKLHLDRKPERPDGVFLFMGPSGVGKTEMARALARALYDDESRLVRLDMSEYMEPHSVARIIGAPPGYVGYGEDGALTGPVSHLDHCVVLLDEVEKAHPRVLNLFLQVFDDGRLTDSKGRLVSFANTVIIMTSNIGRELYAIHGEPAIGFGAPPGSAGNAHPMRDAVQDHLLRVLPSEFVNRIDEIVPFRVLDDDDIILIARRLVKVEAERWEGRGKQVSFTDDVAQIIARTGYDPRLGARHIERNLERLVISLISDAAVTDGFDEIRQLSLSAEDGRICLQLDGKPFECLTDQGHASSAGDPGAG